MTWGGAMKRNVFTIFLLMFVSAQASGQSDFDGVDEAYDDTPVNDKLILDESAVGLEDGKKKQAQKKKKAKKPVRKIQSCQDFADLMLKEKGLTRPVGRYVASEGRFNIGLDHTKKFPIIEIDWLQNGLPVKVSAKLEPAPDAFLWTFEYTGADLFQLNKRMLTKYAEVAETLPPDQKKQNFFQQLYTGGFTSQDMQNEYTAALGHHRSTTRFVFKAVEPVNSKACALQSIHVQTVGDAGQAVGKAEYYDPRFCAQVKLRSQNVTAQVSRLDDQRRAFKKIWDDQDVRPHHIEMLNAAASDLIRSRYARIIASEEATQSLVCDSYQDFFPAEQKK